MDPDHINSLPPTAYHRNVELMVLNASSEPGSKIKTHIILPSTIYGIADNAFTQNGVANNISMQMPELIRVGVARGQGGVLGKGQNVWPNVHIKESMRHFIHATHLFLKYFSWGNYRPNLRKGP